MEANKPRAVTRFAPAPTGSLHIGGARTALFNYLWARRNDGVFRLRFEDTDRTRSSEQNETAILDDLKWLGIEPDGQILRQTDRLRRHSAALAELISRGSVYPCFCPAAETAGEKRVFHAHRCRDLSQEERARRISEGEPHSFRFKVERGREFTFTDRLRGELTAKENSIDDFTVARSDGSVTYLLAAVVDDHDTEVSCVIRGEEHLPNAPKQDMLYDSMGWEKPAWVHIPMILDSERHKLSKRSGATSVGEYRDRGWAPRALVSYLATLSWSAAPADRLVPLEELAAMFDLDAVARFSPVHDEGRMAHFGKLYMAGLSDEYLLGECRGVLDKYAGGRADETDKTLLVRETRAACSTVPELVRSVGNELSFGNEASGETAPAWTREFTERLASIPESEWRSDSISGAIKSFASEKGLKGREIFHPVRVFSTGNSRGAPIGIILSCIGKEETLARFSRLA
ncbi:MAG: glutamate--tRNA ligase [Synergistaceae bacterium]|nr:glutamate--tRNA ligase [Synergistaceae bacterium]